MTKVLSVTELYVSFKESTFIPLVRSETSTTSDFIANCGGLLGLFMGVSVLSIVELIYFFTLRWFCKSKLQNADFGAMQTKPRTHSISSRLAIPPNKHNKLKRRFKFQTRDRNTAIGLNRTHWMESIFS